jgi:hypothetical protein
MHPDLAVTFHLWGLRRSAPEETVEREPWNGGDHFDLAVGRDATQPFADEDSERRLRRIGKDGTEQQDAHVLPAARRQARNRRIAVRSTDSPAGATGEPAIASNANAAANS